MGLPLLLLGLLALVGSTGGALWWIMAGRSSGAAMERASLAELSPSRASDPPPIATVFTLGLAAFGLAVGLVGYLLFLGMEISAFALGVRCRRSGLGKTSMIISAVLVLVSLFFLA